MGLSKNTKKEELQLSLLFKCVSGNTFTEEIFEI